MMKATLLCVIIGICYVQCAIMNITDDIDTLDKLPTMNGTLLDTKDAVPFLLPSFNVSKIDSSETQVKPTDMDIYYKWLNFLKSSTPPPMNNSTVISNLIYVNNTMDS
ncbi:unnamed protein product [Adineta steineri]|uniref:Uncharacterized protein n=1 Tax=Adineta steineri TaxID=433720 RepID=A0A815N9Y4_9BILA|nr:unnamed protein product [Adineta steineri]CAF1436392.1 unnamed protein product [Adineta steineri]CAF3528659.1 unnamed protein product [Adineta steineri]CAF3717987.1 unnamed protein product [Adineta steineri]